MGRAQSRIRNAPIPITPSGERDSALTNVDTVATAPQNALAPVDPKTPPPGSLGLARRAVSIQLKGSNHTRLVLGPWGPLL